MQKSNLSSKPTVSILGCGWYGFSLAKKLVEQGYEVKGSTTTAEKLPLLKLAGIKPYLLKFEKHETIFDEDFFRSTLLIISIPPKRNTPSLSHYDAKIAAIATAALAVKQVIFISSTGVYHDGNAIVDERILPQPNSDSGKAMFAAEEMLRKQTNFSTTIIRFAGLIGPERNLAKHFAGRKEIPNGLAPINLIHLADCIGLTQAIIDQEGYGYTYHGVTPHHPTRLDFYTATCAVSGFEKPEFKQELLDWKQINSVNVPEQLAYDYQVNDWNSWIKSEGVA